MDVWNIWAMNIFLFQVMYALLMPALDPLSDKAFEFQYNFLKSGDAPVILDMLTKNNFLPNADVATKRWEPVKELFLIFISYL